MHPSRNLSRALKISSLLLLFGAAGSVHAQNATQNAAVSAKPAAELKQGPATEHKLAGGTSDEYSLKLQSGQYTRVIAEQRGIDVVISLASPSGKDLAAVDSLNGRFGPEPLSWVATEDGEYTVKVASLNVRAKPGTYTIRVADLRMAMPDDQARLDAQKALAQGAQIMFGQGTPDALRQAIPIFQAAYMQWNQVNDAERKVATLAYIIEAYDQLYSSVTVAEQSAIQVKWNGGEVAFLEKQATAGDASAQVALGSLYYIGLGVNQDYHQAMDWEMKAAAQNREDAQSAIGFDYFKSTGARQDYGEAAKWFQKAAENGFVPAELKLGDMYMNGQGVPPNQAEARKWYQMAADGGDPIAAEHLKALPAPQPQSK